ncbi:MAG: hypothetical protein HZA23_04840 [Nitrospirae bacterium]|nr:hypothetical protein [Nitrospirota bacterium]
MKRSDTLSVLCIDRATGRAKLLPVADLLRLARRPDLRPVEQSKVCSGCSLIWKEGLNQVDVSVKTGGRTVPLKLQPVQKMCLLVISIFSHLGEAITPELLVELRGPNYSPSAIYARVTEIRQAIGSAGLQGSKVIEKVEGGYRIGGGVDIVLPQTLSTAQPRYLCFLRQPALLRYFEHHPGLLKKFESFQIERGLGHLLQER